MSSLQKSMQAMTLSNSLQPHAASNRARRPAASAGAAIPDQIAPRLPPRTPESNDHRVFYGFPVSYPWLVEFCEKKADIIPGYHPGWYSATKVQMALALLSKLSGVPNLTGETVWCKVNEPRVRLGDKGYTPFLAVCSSMKSSWDRRPSNAQLEKLKGLVGEEPDWFVDVNPSSFYRN